MKYWIIKKSLLKNFERLGCGGANFEITREQIEALLNGKLIELYDGEYAHIIKLAD